VQADFTDLDGDGLPESTYWNTTGGANQYKFDLAQGPPRLLRTVANGRGATTTILYASMHDATTVVQNPDETWPDGRPKASPRDQWVARSVSTVDTFANTTSTTTYQYQNPRFGPDDDGRHGFRGFEQVTTTSPSGMQTVQRYGYTPDWSGRLVATLVFPAEDATKVRSIDRTTWEARDLSGTAVRTFHATLTEHLTCANDQDETACTPSAAPAYRRTESTLTQLPLTGPKMLWQETGSRLQQQVEDADGDRETTTEFEVVSTATSYRVRPVTSTKTHQVGGALVVFAKSAQTWDPTFSFKLTDELWFDGDDSHRAITGFVPDMTTGNVIGRYKPKQNAAGTTRAVFTFDSRQLFVATETNELGHPFDYEYEYGTGTKLVTTGPNVRACTTQPNCVSDPLHPVREQKKIRVDGMGRTIERWETASSDGLVYTLRQFGRTTYVDAPSGSTPTSVLEETELSATFAGQYKQERTELDGHGRPIRKILYAQGAAPADHITSFHYRNDGTLETVSVPDPTANDASVVTYTYGFDSLGRPTSIRRPDTALLLDQSGADIVYDGVTKTVSEKVRAGGGQAAVTRTITDSFGRLIEVDEQIAKLPDLFTSTPYTYGPDDLVARVVDPEQVTTDLVHDFAGHRIEIRRHGRTWKYGYDKNGNMVSEQVPCSPNPCDQDPIAAALHTTMTAYDDLDRPSSRLIAQRDLNPADRALFASDTETFTWDIGPNHKGYLRFWRAFAPNASTASIELEAWNDNQGRRNITRHALTIAGLPALSRGWQQNYRPFGGINATTYSDRFEVGGPVTTSTINYDLRGFPRAMQLVRGGLADPEYNINIATLTRNVAGLVTKRRADTVTGSMDFIESNWTYDKLGRVSSQVVQKGPGAPTQVVRQDLTYFDNDDPKTLTHTLGTDAKQFAFGYDLRHQLTSANETTTAGYFTSSYLYGTAGRLARATLQQDSPPPGSELRPRDVNYVYGDADPERVTALLDAGSNAPFSSYTYDAAGNRTSQCEGVMQVSLCLGESIDYVYDGDDHLRRATKKLAGVVQGSEESWYDNAGQRIAIVRRDAAGNKTELVWFLGDSEAHFDGTGTLTHVYSHLSLGTPVARVDRTSNSSAPVEFQYHGLTSNTLAAVAYNGTTNSAFRYTPFGEVLETTDAGGAAGAAAHRRRFNDKHQDEITDLRYYGFRYYDAVALKWSQSDPLFRFLPESAWAQPRRANLYTFSLNNPLKYIDPDGRNNFIFDLIEEKAEDFVEDFVEATLPINMALAEGVNTVITQLSPEHHLTEGLTEGFLAVTKFPPVSDSISVDSNILRPNTYLLNPPIEVHDETAVKDGGEHALKSAVHMAVAVGLVAAQVYLGGKLSASVPTRPGISSGTRQGEVPTPLRPDQLVPGQVCTNCGNSPPLYPVQGPMQAVCADCLPDFQFAPALQ
jgi:RHS repeat-associated protein